MCGCVCVWVCVCVGVWVSVWDTSPPPLPAPPSPPPTYNITTCEDISPLLTDLQTQRTFLEQNVQYCSIFFWTKGYKHNVHFLNKVFRIQYFPEKKGLRHNNVLRTFPVQGIAFYLLNKMLKTKMHIPWVKMSINIVHLFL